MVGKLQKCGHCGFPCVVPKARAAESEPPRARSFFSQNPKTQAELLGIPFEEVWAEPRGRTWISPFSGRCVGPEQVVLEAYEQLGWIGEPWHGFSLYTLQEAICHTYIHDHCDRDSLAMFYGQILTAHWVACGYGKRSELIDLPLTVPEKTVRKGFRGVLAYYRWAGTYRDVLQYAGQLETCVFAIWRILGRDRLRRLFWLQLGGDSWKYYTGWPDLTLVLENNLLFIEVKTTDRILPQQYEILSEVAPALQLDCRIARVSLGA